MRERRVNVASFLLVTLAASAALAQAPGSLVATWKVVEVVTKEGTNAGTNAKPQPGLVV